MAQEAHARWQLASESTAAAKMHATSDAATLLQMREASRARVPSRCAEKS